MTKIKGFFAPGFAMLLALVVGMAILSPSPLNAQSTYGSIVGTVSDTTGAIVPGATVTVTNLGTGEVKTTISDSSGNYDVVNLLPANYKVDVQKANFKRFERQPVEVEVGATVRINASLAVGAASETVEVTTQAPLLQTDSGSLSTEVEGKTVDEMPLNGRNTMNLLALAAGVVPQGSTSGGTGMNQGTHTNWQGWDNYQIGGSLAGENSVYLDGAPNNSLGGNSIDLVVTQDAVQEFNVTSNNMTADYGRNAGAVINMATKGGTNQFHGSAYEYLRNTILNANEFFNKQGEIASGKKNKPLQWNQDQYGVAFGGPVKKDKLFFHFTWEKYFADSAKPGPGLVPTAAQVAGQAVPAAAYSVLTGALASSNTCVFTNNGSGTYTITNLWTSGCGDPLAKIIRGYYPTPTPNYNSNGDNFYTAPASADRQQQYNARVDYTLSNKQRLFARYTYWRINDTGSAGLANANGWITQNAATASYAHQAILGDTYTFNPTTVLDVRLSYLRHNDFDSLPGSLGTFKNSVFSGTYYTAVASQMDENVLPNYSFNGNSQGYDNDFAMTFFSGYWFNTYAIDASLTKVKGNHNIKVGGEIRLMQSTNQGGGGPSENSGVFNFNGDFTGDGWTDFLLGYVYNGQGGNAGSLGLSNSITNYSWYQAYYVTDTWQASHRLTVTAGLRYELPGGLYERHGQNTVLLPNYQWTTSGNVAVTGALGLLNSTPPGGSLIGNSAINLHHDLFAPRIGLAYRLGNNTAVRGGYGLSYLAVDTTGNALAQNSPINDQSTSCGSKKALVAGQHIPDPNQMMYNCFGPAGVNNDAVGNPLITPPGRSLNGGPLVTYLGDLATTNSSVSGPLPQQNAPYTQQWNLSVSRQFPGAVMAEVGYAGSKGSNLPGLGSNFNQIPDSVWLGKASTDSALTASAVCAKTGTTISVAQCDRPYPWYGNVSDSVNYTASTIYHALQAKAEKRFKAGGTIMANYTWAKIIGNTDSSVGGFLETNAGISGPPGGGGGGIQDYDNLAAERTVLQYNVPQRAVISYVTNLPFGHGQLWLKDATGLVDHLVSGWGLNGITTFQKGFHLAIGDSLVRGGPSENADLSSYGFGSLRPNYTAGCAKMSGVSGSYAGRVLAGQTQFNTGCFSQPADWTPGSEPRVDSNLFAEGIDNFDFTAMKTTNITEQVNLQFRAEFFNLFNRIQFAPPGTSLGQNNGPVPAFGEIFATANQPRLAQLSLRLNF